jgi:predicted nucleic acid-binding protein
VIAYFDTSAVVPLVITAAGSTRAAMLWDGAERAVSVRLVYPEGRAALAQAQRLGRLTVRQFRAAVREFEARYLELDLVEFDDVLARRAGHLAEIHGLRGYYAVHLAAAERVRDPELVVVAGDRALLKAAAAEAMATSSLS